MRLILALALLGMLLSGYALTLHYKDDGKSICNLSEGFNCDKVNKSPWAELFSIPVALLGLLSYLGLFLLVLKRTSIGRTLAFTKRDVLQYPLIIVLVMAGFQAYLTLIEAFIIHAYCIICLMNQAVVLALAVLLYRAWRKA